MMEDKKNNKKECYFIICIDDDNTFLDSLSMALPDRLSKQYPEFNYQFEFVNNISELFQLIKELKDGDEKVALIISDQKMPEMSGIKLFEKLTKDLPDTMRMLLTGYAGLDSAKYAINNHLLDQYITKPIDDYDNFISIISHLIKKFHLQLLKIKQEEEIRGHLKTIQVKKKKIEKMLNTAEEIAYFAKDIKMLDIDEILNLTMKKIPLLFDGCNKVSIFLILREEDRVKLGLARSNHIENNIEFIMDDIKGSMPVKEIIEDISGKIIKERLLTKEHYTPLQKAIKDDSVLVISDTQKSDLKLLNKEELGKSCVIIPFITKLKVDLGDEHLDLEETGELNVGGVLNVSGLEIKNEEIKIIKYKASLLKDILGSNIRNAQIFSVTKKMALTDSLTGLYNNRMLNQLLRIEMEKAKRYKNVFSVVVCDIDNFKKINDKFGHLTGDMVLSKLADLFNRTKRNSDLTFRYGGEEFVFLLIPETKDQQAYILIERIRESIEKTTFGNIHITLSFGIAQYHYSEKDETLKELLHRADIALYLAKSKGKNRVEISTSQEVHLK